VNSLNRTSAIMRAVGGNKLGCVW